MEDIDLVNQPPHYNQSNDIECIEAIEASMSEEAFQGYLKGNVIKYTWRYDKKGAKKQDLDKCDWYLTKLRSVQK